ncbi:MAG: tRNA-specific 2-thiouridylase MnmA [Leptospiraceae bacterium]|nr:MAG: tRNA-specific 2-thiouridylase MnmA [Leptospiraceae bacterium]
MINTLPINKFKDINLPEKNTKIVVAMSGGVDSAVTALILHELGYEVIGVNLKVWEYEENCDIHKKSCCSPKDIYDAKSVGMQLNIPFYVIKMENVFKEKVIERFILDYQKGRTPNPCVECNTFVKFGALLEKSKALGISWIATGHYAKIYKTNSNRYTIQNGVDETKNQAYYLYGLSQDALANTIFPLGNFTKPEVRELAKHYQLPVAEKLESQEICFVPENDYRKFLKKQGVEFTPGYFKDIHGRILGKHSGKEQFTIGQRKGLGISWKEPLYVIEIHENGDVILGPINQTLFRSFEVEQVNFLYYSEEEFKNLFTSKQLYCRVQIRYRSKPQNAFVEYLGYDDSISWNGLPKGHKIKVTMENSVPAVTPGQSAVFYPLLEEMPNDILLMGGIISKENLIHDL